MPKQVLMPDNIDKVQMHITEFCEWTDYDRDWVSRLVDAGAVFRAARGYIYLKSSLCGVIKYLRGKKYGEDSIKRRQAQARSEEAEAEIKEIELREKKEELVDVDALSERMEKPIIAMRQLILSEVHLTADCKEEIILNLQELYGSIFGKQVRTEKLQALMSRIDRLDKRLKNK